MGEVKRHKRPRLSAQWRAVMEMSVWMGGYAGLTVAAIVWTSPELLVAGILCGVLAAVRAA